MKKKIILSASVIVLAVVLFFAWKIYGPAVHLEDKESSYLYIKTGSSAADVKQQLTEKKFLSGTTWFSMASSLLKYNTVKPGRYKVTSGMSVLNLVRMLKNGSQTAVNLVITKLRTKESLAQKLGNNFIIYGGLIS
ncbi:MAG: endolytic transglycosylase MltG [Chitinophagaceae bacterium]